MSEFMLLLARAGLWMGVGVFDAALIAAARQWRFAPRIVDGQAVASAVQVPITFAMDAPGEADEGR